MTGASAKWKQSSLPHRSSARNRALDVIKDLSYIFNGNELRRGIEGARPARETVACPEGILLAEADGAAAIATLHPSRSAF
jgi:hypothetical protein